MEIRDAIASLLAALPFPAKRGTDVQRGLGLAKKLAWQVARLIESDDQAEILQLLPRQIGLEILLKAAGQHATTAQVARVRRAAQQLDSIVEQCGGDWTDVEMLLRPNSAQGRGQAEEAQRRAVFQAQAFLLGLRARTRLTLTIVQENEERRTRDVAYVSGTFQISRTRPDIVWPIAETSFSDSRGPGHGPVIRQRLSDPVPGPGGELPLMPEFCVPRTPDVALVVIENGPQTLRRVELAPGPVGPGSATTVILGEVFREMPGREGTDHDSLSFLTHIRVPCETLVQDLYLRADQFGAVKPAVDVLSEVWDVPRAGGVDYSAQRIPMEASVEHLGRGLVRASTQDVPDYPALARHVFDRLKWDSDLFDLYRLVLRYPLVATGVQVTTPSHPAHREK